MGRKNKHSVRFQKKDDIFKGITDEEIQTAIEDALPEDVTVEKCFCEYPKPYGHRPYVSTIIVEQKHGILNPEERSQIIKQAVEHGIKSIIDGDIDKHIIEGWA